MLLPTFKKILLGITTTLTAVAHIAAQTGCTLSARGGDDAPQLLQAVRSCATTLIPEGTTLNIATRMNMTGLSNKRIVSRVLYFSILAFDLRSNWREHYDSIRISRTGLGYAFAPAYVPSLGLMTVSLEWVLHSIPNPDHILASWRGKYSLDWWGNTGWRRSGKDDLRQVLFCATDLTQLEIYSCGMIRCKYECPDVLDAYAQNCSATNSSLLRPITLTIFQATNVLVENITMVNGPEWHNLVRIILFNASAARNNLTTFQVNEANGVVYNNIHINAKSNSSHNPANTDGWNVYRSDNVTIKDSVIVNGDDCVAFKPSKLSVLKLHFLTLKE
jgi:polygalacturonase